jgi:hypothetical protein
LESNAKPSISAEIFLDSISTVFLLNRAEPWTLNECTEEIGMFLMDDWPSHVTDDVIHPLTET